MRAIAAWKTRRGFTFSAPDFGSRGPGSCLGQGPCVVFLGKQCSLTVPLSTKRYEWVLQYWTKIVATREHFAQN